MNLTTNKRSLALAESRKWALPIAVRTPLLFAVLFVLALLPRAVMVGSFLTIDEAYYWIDRAREFLQAIRTADWRNTNLVGHPGVTTMWLGAMGFALHYTLNAWGLADWPDANVLRILVRLPVAIVTSLCVVLSYPLLRRLVSARVAVLAVLFWAGEPFLVAHSQLLHVDALLTSFMIMAILWAMLAFRLDGQADVTAQLRWKMLLASGVATGLAALTKSPSVVLVPTIVLIACVGMWRRPATANWWSRYWALVVLPLLVWGATILLIWFSVWPATWVDPIGTVKGIIVQAREDGMEPHGWGNFFWGHAVADPGLFFYPVAVALRLTPWSLIGLMAALVAALLGWRNWRAHGPLLLLLVFVVLFITMLTIAPKKFDRYALPIFPALDILSAFGVIWLLNTLRKLYRAAQPVTAMWAATGCLLVVLVLAMNLAWFHPYELSYYNQLLGGGAVAVKVIPVGWGEGLDQAGAFINTRPDATDRRVATWYWEALTPVTKARVSRLSEVTTRPERIGYVVLYIDQEQRRDEPAITDMLYTQYEPLYTVRIHGIEYAKVYQLAQPIQHALSADFGDAIHLNGYDLDTQTPGLVKLTLHWMARATTSTAAMVFVHVLDAQGNRIAQVDLPVGDREQTSTWMPGSISSQVIQFPLPADAPIDRYWLALGLYDPTTGARLPLQAPAQPGAPADGEHALLLPPEHTAP